MSAGFVLNIDDKLLNNLEKADELVQDIGKHSEQTRDMFNNAFQSMATGSLNDFISKLAEAKRAISDVGSANVQFNGVVNISNQAVKASDDIVNLVSTLAKLKHIMSQMGGDNFSAQGLFNMGGQTKEITKELRADLRKTQTWMTKLKEATDAYENSIVNLSANIARAKDAQRSFNEELKRASKQQAGGLINQQGQARTLNELKAYAKELQKTMANLDPKSSEWEKLNKIYKQTNREIKSINNSMKDLNNTHKSLINTADQLKRAFALMFSVSAIKGYVTQIARVRGEFELQQRSLQAILQNKDEADRLWQQTVQLAVRSPFQVKELVTYTKQLAAYRVESDKLYDTTKMLADVSAGLGVDMNRLILAYGQVKAANYLRGTELRQFSEAGVNILAELAKYFTEVEGRAVSVGDVFERVSKRMVTFADVEEIFKRITSEGGVFYNMQEVQAETLKGQISNLRDAIDIMLNEIGKEGEDAMKGTITTLRELISNWKEVEFYLSKVIVAYATYKGAVGIASLANSSLANGLLDIITKSDTATKAFDKLSNGIENVLSKLFKSQAAISGIKTLLGGLATLGVTAAIAAIAVGLMEVWRRATKTSRELKALNKELEQIYNQDTNALDKQIKGFENLVNRLKTVNKGSREHKDIIGALNQNYGEYLGFIVNEATTYEQLANNINSVNLALTNKAKLNTYEKAYGKVLEKNNEIISERQGTIKKQLEKVDVLRAGDIIQLNENEINDIFALFEKKVANAGRAGYDLAKEAFKEYGVEIEYGDIFNWGVFTEYGEAILRNKEEEIKLQNRINSLYGGATASTIEMRQELERINEEEKKELANAETRRQKEEVRLKYAKQRIDAEVKYEGLGSKEADKRIAALQKKSETIIDVNNKIMNSVDKLGSEYADMIYIDDEQATQGIDAIAKSAAESYEMQISLIKAQNNLKKAGTKYEQDAIDNATKAAQAYKYLLTILGRQDLLEAKINKENKGKLGTLNKQISALKEANSMYEKLKQTRDESTAKSDVAKAFNPLFSELGIANITQNMDFTKSGVYKVLQKLPNIAGKKGEEALEKIKAVFKSQIDLDLEVVGLNDLKRQIDESFENYQLYIELKNLGIPKDIMKSFFGDVVDFNELKEWTKRIEPILLEYGDKGIEANKNMNEKILKMEREYAKERVKTYVKYLMEAQREAVKIKVEELRKLKEIEESKEFTTEQKQEIKNRVRKETNAELQKQEWADFQNSEMYTMMFEDLEHYGTQALETLREKLIALKGSLTDLPASEVKEIINQLSKIEDITIERNPFRALKETRKQIKAEGVTEKQAQTNLAQSENEIAKLQSELDIINIVNTAKAQGLAIDEKTQNAYDDIVTEMADMGVAEADIVKTKKESLELEKKNAETAKQQAKNYADLDKARVAALNKTKNILSSIQDATKASLELMDSLGVSSDSVAYSLAEGVDGMISLTLSAIEFGIQMETLGYQSNMALGIIGWIAIGIQAVATAISAIFKMHDAGLQKQIDDLATETADLQEKFDALNETIDNAYNTDQLRTAAADAKQYTQQMISNYDKMKQLEEDKKKTDEDAVKEYENNIKEQREALRELEQQIVSEATAGILDNAADAARGFVDAWYDAFKETGNGLKGLEDNFNEMFLDLAKQQATMQIAGRFAKQWEQDLSKYINETDTELTKAEAQKWAEEVKATFPALNDALEGFLGVVTEGVGATGELSGLEKGIAGASEETVQVVASYLNSLRFFVADNNSVMKQLRDYVIGTDDTANPMLAHLRTIAEQTSAMRALLDSVTQSGHPKGQSGIRVFID